MNSQVANGVRGLMAEKKPEVPPKEEKPKDPMEKPMEEPVDPKPPGPKKPVELDFGE